jgi:hypothetical protein
MIERSYDENGNSKRRDLDNELGVVRWRIPGQPVVAQPDRDPAAPSWWDDDEEASQSFLDAMGVAPNG